MLPSTDDVVTVAAAFGTMVDPVFVGGRFLWHLRVFDLDRFYCPDCRARIRTRSAELADVLAASTAHACPALLASAPTFVPLSVTAANTNQEETHATQESVHTGVSSEDGRGVSRGPEQGGVRALDGDRALDARPMGADRE